MVIGDRLRTMYSSWKSGKLGLVLEFQVLFLKSVLEVYSTSFSSESSTFNTTEKNWDGTTFTWVACSMVH